MRTKTVIIILGATVAIVTLIFGVYLTLEKEVGVTQVVTVESPIPVLAEEIITWNDPANFSFQYPKSISLNPHTEDQDNYAHVELTSATYPGNLIVWVKDTTADTVDNWVIQGNIKNAIDSNVAGIPAKKVLTIGDVNKLIISTIREGYLYQIEANLADNDYWNKTLDTVLSSFEFTSANNSAVQDNNTTPNNEQAPDASSNEEEVIE